MMLKVLRYKSQGQLSIDVAGEAVGKGSAVAQQKCGTDNLCRMGISASRADGTTPIDRLPAYQASARNLLFIFSTSVPTRPLTEAMGSSRITMCNEPSSLPPRDSFPCCLHCHKSSLHLPRSRSTNTLAVLLSVKSSPTSEQIAQQEHYVLARHRLRPLNRSASVQPSLVSKARRKGCVEWPLSPSGLPLLI